MGVSPSLEDSAVSEMLARYMQLHPKAQLRIISENSRTLIALLRESKRFAAAPEVPALRSLPLYSLAVSAGTGQFLDGESYEMQPVGPEVPEEANFGVRVAGDSMEPRFHDGQTVWVHQQPTLTPGEIGVFLYDGSAYLKQLRRDGGRVWLHSLNPAYHDLEISDAFPLRVLGKAVS